MEHKETLKGQYSTTALIHDEEYFKYIFKKTEKIVSTVFYVTRHLNDNDKKDIIIIDIEARSRTLLTTVEETLLVGKSALPRYVDRIRQALFSLEAMLKVARSSGLIGDDLVAVFEHEFALFHRALRDYGLQDGMRSIFGDDLPTLRTRAYREKGETRVRSASPMGNQAGGGSTGSEDRTSRILSVIKDKGEVGIKDIADVVSDVSEKTIQRELMSLISQGRISKSGERRWSRYRIV